MNPKQRTLIILVLITIVIISSCGPRVQPILLEDIPLHPNAGDKIDTSFETNIPENQYEKYEVEGPDYYFIWNDDLEELSINDFYQKELTALEWQPGEQTMYLSKFGSFCAGQPWLKGDQVIYLVTYPHSFQNITILAVFLLTK